MSHRLRTLFTIGVASLLLVAGSSRGEASCGTNAFTGQICTFAFDFCPPGFLPADGRLLPITGNNIPLFAVYGTLYGGNGSTTFGLPDLRGRTIVGAPIGSEAIGQTAGDATTVSLRVDNQSGGVTVPTARSPFTGLTHCVVVQGIFPPRPSERPR
jgi:microcystin-dependent protein